MISLWGEELPEPMRATPSRTSEKKTGLVITKDADLRQALFGNNVMHHPAKQSLVQLYHLLDRFAVPGGMLVDPFGGSGSAMLAAGHPYGMYVVTCELAKHFLTLQEQAWQHFRCTMAMQDCYGTPAGDYMPLYGDSRNLAQVMVDAGANLPEADLIITSPSYGGSEAVDRRKKQNGTIAANRGSNAHRQGYVATQPLGDNTHAAMVRDEQGYKRIDCHHGGRLQRADYADLVITSPPYDGAMKREHTVEAQLRDEERLAEMRRRTGRNYGATQGSSWRSYDNPDDRADLIVTSPPYDAAVGPDRDRGLRAEAKRRADGKVPASTLAKASPNSQVNLGSYDDHADSDTRAENIGNQRGSAYLASMALVWQQCALVLRPSGILCCITRDCVRDGKRVPVGQQNRELIEAAGLEFVECEEWQLTQESFWRILQRRKAEAQGKVPVVIDSEQVQIFRRPEAC